MSLLDEAVVDAITLKEAALKNAEAMILERYSIDVKQVLESFLNEQEDLGLGEQAPVATMPMAGATSTEESDTTKDIPYAFKDRKNKGIPDKEKLCDGGPCPEDEEQIEIPLANIAEALNLQLNRTQKAQSGFEINKEELLNVFEKLTVDAKVVPHGHTYLATNAEIEHAFDIAQAKKVQLDKEMEEEYGKVKKENKDLKGKLLSYHNKMKEIVPVAEVLANKVEKYEIAIETLQEKLGSLTLSNAKLLYKNRVLSNDSLNERQKSKIVETLTNAKTIEEAKMIYETLQGSTQTINTNISKSPKSLSEAIVRNSLSIPERLQENSSNSPAMERMKILAGIKNK
jgi:hypothetical protein